MRCHARSRIDSCERTPEDLIGWARRLRGAPPPPGVRSAQDSSLPVSPHSQRRGPDERVVESILSSVAWQAPRLSIRSSPTRFLINRKPRSYQSQPPRELFLEGRPLKLTICLSLARRSQWKADIKSRHDRDHARTGFNKRFAANRTHGCRRHCHVAGMVE